MMHAVLFLQGLLIIASKVLHLRAECNVCSSAIQMACVSETSYQFCVDNLPSGPVNTCPSGYVCSTSTTVVCVPNTAAATCNDCNRCDTKLIFACTDVNTFALCLGQTTPSTTATYSCPADQVCSLTSPQICASTITVAATCPTAGTSTSTSTSTTTVATTTTTTAAITNYAQYFCSVMRVNTRFQMPTTLDNSCKRYIYCVLTTAGTWSGQIYTCSGSTYYDALTLRCIATRPSTC